MASTYIEVDDEAVRAVLDRLSELGADMTPLMRAISEDMMAAVEDRFANESTPADPWVDLAASTKKAREKRGTWPGKKLQESGRLLSSIVPFYDNQEAGVGTNVIYAAIHNFGGQAGRNHSATIPARPFFVLGEDDLQRIYETADGFLDQVIQGGR